MILLDLLSITIEDSSLSKLGWVELFLTGQLHPMWTLPAECEHAQNLKLSEN